MSILKNKNGYTMIEIMVVTAIMLVISFTCMGLLVNATNSYNQENAQAYSDFDAILAMQKMVAGGPSFPGIREAKDFDLQDGGQRLWLIFPQTDPHGYWNREEEDPFNTQMFYLSDETGNLDVDGTVLWVRKYDGTTIAVARNISNLMFNQDPSSEHAVSITITSTHEINEDSARDMQLEERVVYLRNY